MPAQWLARLKRDEPCPQLNLLKLCGAQYPALEQELELLAMIATLKLPSLSQLSLKLLSISERMLSAWLHSSWAPSLRQLALPSMMMAVRPHTSYVWRPILGDASSRDPREDLDEGWE